MFLGEDANIIKLRISEIIRKVEIESYNVDIYDKKLLVMSFDDCIWIMKSNANYLIIKWLYVL